MKEKKTNGFLKNKKMAVLLTLGVIMVTFGITWAFYNSIQTLANPLTTGHSGAAIVEDFDPTASFLPGETAVKKVAFANTGDMELFLRVKVPPTENWYKGKQILGMAEGFDTSKVIKNWTEYWPDYTGSAPKSQWTKGSDGYYYYNKILSPKGETGDHTEDILASITLDPSVSNDRHAVDYSDKTYVLTFEAEAVPVDEGFVGVGTEWSSVSVKSNNDGTLTWTSK